MKKTQLIKGIKKLSFGGIYYGFKDGKLININNYNEEDDTFTTYGEDMKCHSLPFEELPSTLWKND